MNFHRPTSSDRFRARLAQREGFDFAPGPVTAVYCQLFDMSGGGGPTSTETTQTTSGSARGVAGNKNQYTESGSIGLQGKATYLEAGSQNNSGQRNATTIKLGKGASYVVNQIAPQPQAPATGSNPPSLAPVDVPGPSPDLPSAPASPTTDTSSSTSTTFLATLQGYWANFSIWQKLGAATVTVLILWLVFHKRK